MSTKIHLAELKKALDYIDKNSNDLYPVLRITTNSLEIAFINRDGESTCIIVYDENTRLPAKVTQFSRL